MIAYRAAIKSKLTDRGYPALFVGYTDNHSSDVFKFYKLRTGAIIESRDVLWLSKTHHEYMKMNGEETIPSFAEPAEFRVSFHDSDYAGEGNPSVLREDYQSDPDDEDEVESEYDD